MLGSCNDPTDLAGMSDEDVERFFLNRKLTPPLCLWGWASPTFSILLTKFLSIISDFGRVGFGLEDFGTSCSRDLLFQNPIRLLSLDMIMIYWCLSLSLYINYIYLEWYSLVHIQLLKRFWTSSFLVEFRLQNPLVISPFTCHLIKKSELVSWMEKYLYIFLILKKGLKTLQWRSLL